MKGKNVIVFTGNCVTIYNRNAELIKLLETG